MDASEITKGITNFITEQFLDGDGEDLDEHTSLLALGIIDSIEMISLLGFIEQQLGISIPEDEVSPRNFMSIAALCAMILRVNAAAPKN